MDGKNEGHSVPRGEAEPLLGGKHRPEGRLRLAAAALGAGCERAARSEVWRLDLTALLFLRLYFKKCI